LGYGCFIDGDVMLEHHVTVDNFVNIYCNNDVGHGSYIGRNCVIQRQCMLAAESHLENDVFMAMRVTALKYGARYGAGSFVQEGIYLRRGTLPDEVVSLKTENPSRVVGQIIE
jgi:UDP-3-O-[3-hydroxymyristoyl] glucosamine N-acyltransferase